MHFKFVALLQACFTNVVSPSIVSRLAFLIYTLQILGIDTAHVTQGMRGRFTQRITTEQARAHFHPGESIALRSKARNFFFG